MTDPELQAAWDDLRAVLPAGWVAETAQLRSPMGWVAWAYWQEQEWDDCARFGATELDAVRALAAHLRDRGPRR